jgi:hypothetical protein
MSLSDGRFEIRVVARIRDPGSCPNTVRNPGGQVGNSNGPCPGLPPAPGGGPGAPNSCENFSFYTFSPSSSIGPIGLQKVPIGRAYSGPRLLRVAEVVPHLGLPIRGPTLRPAPDPHLGLPILFFVFCCFFSDPHPRLPIRGPSRRHALPYAY